MNITKNDLTELKINKAGLIERFENMKPGTYMNPNGGEFEAIGGIEGDNSCVYFRLHAPWSPGNINICWRLDVYNYTKGSKKANYDYTFKTIDSDTMDWFIHANFMYFIE